MYWLRKTPGLLTHDKKMHPSESLVSDTFASVAYLSMPRSQIPYIRHIQQTAATVRGRLN
jgi:hypothetical protein